MSPQIHLTDRIYPDGEHARIIEAKLVVSPSRIVEAMNLPGPSTLILRRRAVYKGEDLISVSDSWFEAALGGVAPRLMETSRILEGTYGYLQAATGRQLTTAHDHVTAEAATEHIAKELGIEAGAPVLKGRTWIHDANGVVIEYGESHSVAGRWKRYEYAIS